eukprot:gene14109-15583_t
MKLEKNLDIMWAPRPGCTTQMDVFRCHVNKKFSLSLECYEDFWKWSVDNIESFWEEFWYFSRLKYSQKFESIVDISQPISDVPEWFHQSRLNFAENLLQGRDDDVAIYTAGERKPIERVTFGELRRRVATLASVLRRKGIKAGDRVAGYIPNCSIAVEAMLATASIGAVWSSTSPDFGVGGVLDRLSQIQPKILFSVDAVVYNNKIHDHLEKVRQVVQGLPELEMVVIIPYVKSCEEIDLSNIPNSLFLSDFLAFADPSPSLTFEQLPFNHPLFIMFSSGTTGPPKCMVHSAGGTLIQHLKEHMLHGDMTKDDIMLYYTTTGWMMWNWLVSVLGVGASVVLYDGSPLIPSVNVLWDLIDEIGITVLGTGARWLEALSERNVTPAKTHRLTSLRSILSTGSPLKPVTFEYVYSSIKKDLILGSITGGTDIISLFAGQNPTIPVCKGEIQCRTLGMAVQSWNDDGEEVLDESGELVCVKAFPCMPIYFWNDHDNIKYKKAYFSKFSGVWAHGDFCQINSKSGGILMLGRSDGTLNPNGVRFGSAEIYHIVNATNFPEITDSLCVGQNHQGRERVVLFLKMAEIQMFNDELVKQVKTKIRESLSARHVPEVIRPINDIPYTTSGKKVEVAVKKILAGLLCFADHHQSSAFQTPSFLEDTVSLDTETAVSMFKSKIVSLLNSLSARRHCRFVSDLSHKIGTSISRTQDILNKLNNNFRKKKKKLKRRTCRYWHRNITEFRKLFHLDKVKNKLNKNQRIAIIHKELPKLYNNIPLPFQCEMMFEVGRLSGMNDLGLSMNSVNSVTKMNLYEVGNIIKKSEKVLSSKVTIVNVADRCVKVLAGQKYRTTNVIISVPAGNEPLLKWERIIRNKMPWICGKFALDNGIKVENLHNLTVKQNLPFSAYFTHILNSSVVGSRYEVKFHMHLLQANSMALEARFVLSALKALSSKEMKVLFQVNDVRYWSIDHNIGATIQSVNKYNMKMLFPTYLRGYFNLVLRRHERCIIVHLVSKYSNSSTEKVVEFLKRKRIAVKYPCSITNGVMSVVLSPKHIRDDDAKKRVSTSRTAAPTVVIQPIWPAPKKAKKAKEVSTTNEIIHYKKATLLEIVLLVLVGAVVILLIIFTITCTLFIARKRRTKKQEIEEDRAANQSERNGLNPEIVVDASKLTEDELRIELDMLKWKGRKLSRPVYWSQRSCNSSNENGDMLIGVPLEPLRISTDEDEESRIDNNDDDDEVGQGSSCEERSRVFFLGRSNQRSSACQSCDHENSQSFYDSDVFVHDVRPSVARVDSEADSTKEVDCVELKEDILELPGEEHSETLHHANEVEVLEPKREEVSIWRLKEEAKCDVRKEIKNDHKNSKTEPLRLTIPRANGKMKFSSSHPRKTILSEENALINRGDSFAEVICKQSNGNAMLQDDKALIKEGTLPEWSETPAGDAQKDGCKQSDV